MPAPTLPVLYMIAERIGRALARTIDILAVMPDTDARHMFIVTLECGAKELRGEICQ